MPNATPETLHPIIHQKVSVETRIYSDDWVGYQGLEEDYAGHEVVHHRTLDPTGFVNHLVQVLVSPAGP